MRRRLRYWRCWFGHDWRELATVCRGQRITIDACARCPEVNRESVRSSTWNRQTRRRAARHLARRIVDELDG